LPRLEPKQPSSGLPPPRFIPLPEAQPRPVNPMSADPRTDDGESARLTNTIRATLRVGLDASTADGPGRSAGHAESTEGPLDPADVAIDRESFWWELARLGIGEGRVEPGQRYTLEEVLGSGGGGHVLLGHDSHLDRTVAVKVQQLAASEGGGTLNSELFLKEAVTTARLDHPNIVPIHDLDITGDGRIYLTMKNIEGRSLGSLIRDAKQSGQRPESLSDPNWIASTMLSVCHALAYAHAKNVLHQDVKPDNIMIGNFDEVLLIDWGTASDGDTVGVVQGTPVFMSPEQARGERADERSDVYCVGGTILSVLALRYPLGTADADTFWERKRRGEVEPVTHAERNAVSPRLMAIALKALESDPDQRYPTIRALADDLRRFQAGLAISIYRDSLPERCIRFYQARRALSKTIAVSLLTLAMVSGAYVARLQRKNEDIRRHETGKLRAELAEMKLEAERVDQWIPVISHDFRTGAPLDERFEIRGDLDVSRGAPFLAHRSQFSGLVWRKEPLASEPRIEVAFRCREQPRLIIHVSSTTHGFHRSLELGEGVAELVKYRDIYSGYQIISQWPVDEGVFFSDKINRIVFWQKNNTWFAEVNGHSVLRHYDEYPNVQTGELLLDIGRWSAHSDLQLESVSISRRQPALYVPILETGRALLRAGDDEAARAFFLRQVRINVDKSVAAEAEYLAASLHVGPEQNARLAELSRIAQNESHPFRYHAMHRQILLLAESGAWREALDKTIIIVSEAPRLNTFTTVWPALLEHIKDLPGPEKMAVLSRVARLPTRHLGLREAGISDLTFMEGSGIRSLSLMDNSDVLDLSPLASLSLEKLVCIGTAVDDLAPLAGMPLKHLSICRTRVRDLSPLRGMSLDTLYARRCEALDLTTLKDVRLSSIILDGTPVKQPMALAQTGAAFVRMNDCGLTDLDCLKGMRPVIVRALRNQISNISGVAGMELHQLILANNRIQDITPLRSCVITESLNLSENPLRDISALAGQPVKELYLAGTLVEDFSVLRELERLERLDCSGSTVTAPDGTESVRAITNIDSLTGLKLDVLSLANNRIQDIRPLRSCVITESLDLSGNPISDISCLAGHPVRDLHLADTKVTDLSVLKTMVHLRSVALEGIALDEAARSVVKTLESGGVIVNASH
jgi:Leucine-rich repeat (LRR) protein